MFVHFDMSHDIGGCPRSCFALRDSTCRTEGELAHIPPVSEVKMPLFAGGWRKSVCR